MTTPTPTIDVERLAREAGFDVHPRKGEIRVGLDAMLGIDSTDKIRKFAALVLEEAAMRVEVASYRSRWARACSNSKRVAEPCEYAAIVRALAAGVR